jgi:hypothetical protein
LSLGPNQVAIVPVTFLPRYPDLDDGMASGYAGEARPPPALSSINRLDLVHLVGEDILDVIESRKYINMLDSDALLKRRHNLDPSTLPKGDEFEVGTTVVVDTSRGVLKLPISATSVRHNSYSIPDTILFHHPEAVKDSESASLKEASPSLKQVSPPGEGVILISASNVREDSSLHREKSRPVQAPRDCFDLYLSNPLPDRDLEISEVLISRPELMSVEFEPSRLLLAPDLVVLSSGPGQVIREWTEEGPMYLPADSDDNYVATVCTASSGVNRDESSDVYLEEMANWIDSGSPDKSLGFLQIRTDAETLFIGLERFDGTPEPAPSQAQIPNEAAKGVNSTALSSSSILLRSTPDHLSFNVVSSTSQKVYANFGLQNKSPVPIRIMRLSVGLDTGIHNSKLEASRLIGLNINIELKGNETLSAQTLDSFILGAAETTADDAFLVVCAVNADTSSIKQTYQEALSFTGTILLRGTMDTNMRYHEWKEEIKQNPYLDFHLTLEIPYTVSVLNGRVDFRIDKSTHPIPELFGFQPWDESGLSITSLFFPMTRYVSLDGADNPGRAQQLEGSVEIGHDLRIRTNMAIPMSLEGAVIEDSQGREVLGSDSPCRHFNVSVATTPIRESPESLDYEDLGLISLHYKSRREGTRDHHTENTETDQLYPATCFLRTVTDPVDTGIHRVPLIIFPGQVEVSSPNSFFELESIDNTGGRTSAAVGFQHLLVWFRTTAVGRSFLEVLAEMSGERRFHSDSHLLFSYIKKLCLQSSKVEKSRLKPILLKLGAVEHSDLARAPLFLTNHNPVPIYVSIDVGEVEGMSIVLGREGSQGPGDGNDILDYLPKQSDLLKRADKRILVGAGKYKGHPLDGLRQFLVSNEEAISFSSRFPYRDAITMSRTAVARQPILQQLYKHYSYVEFHRSSLPERKFSKSSLCDSSLHPPSYNSFETSDGTQKQQSLPRGFIASADKMLARRLSTCREVAPDKDTDKNEVSTKILIPPGGVARFELRLRAPSQSYLESDISQLLATGLVLSTNFGQVMPIFATFEALQGQLQVSQLGSALPTHAATSEMSSFDRGNMTVVAVPPGFSWETTRAEEEGSSHLLSLVGYGSHGGVPLHLSSSFSREVRLVDVESCNPWFNVALRNQPATIDRDPDVAIDVGSLQCSVDCESVDGDVPPSYYQCALNWLKNRSDLQPPSCGVAPLLQKRTTEDKGGTEASHRGMGRVVKAFENAIKQLNGMYESEDSIAISTSNKTSHTSFYSRSRAPIGIKSGRKRSDGFVPAIVLDTFAEAWDAWRVASEFGLNTLSSTLRATIEYDVFSEASDDEDSGVGTQSLSLSMHNLAVESVLAAPQLFDPPQRIAPIDFERSRVPGEEPSILLFPPTLVGKVTSLTIPLRNPTAVPIRVRIGAASPDFKLDKDADTFGADETIRKRYFRNQASPYIQNGQSTIIQNESAQHLWWDGGGAFFLSDSRGDVIRSHHNITIRAGAGAHVSLVNPSLHASVAFIVGCGARCGVRDDSQPQKSSEQSIDPKLTSPIGASAAAGITLAGRKRWHLPQVNAMGSDEPFIHAGGAPLPGSGGPAAFAVPYASLDEIIIPPFGVGEIGPILFRPPGRYGVLGCDTAKETGANHWGVKTAELCDSQAFESMIFLENSLTGLERLTLRGESMWESLYFLDPPPEDGQDAYGDIETYNGWPTLFFEGTATARKTSAWKEVHLRNAGDTAIAVSVVYMADSSRVLDKRWPSAGVSSSACSAGSFRLLNCWESSRKTTSSKGHDFENIRSGFRLEPGENRSLFVEHAADCTKQEEFVSLNVEYESISAGFDFLPRFGLLSMSRSGEIEHHETKSRSSSSKKKVNLMIGYRMNYAEIARCTPVKIESEVAFSRASPVGQASKQSEQRRVARARYGSLLKNLLRFLAYITMIVATILLTGFVFERRSNSMAAAWPILWSLTSKLRPQTTAKAKRRGQLSIWNAAFRCLSRADPASAELQVLGKEQIRQVMIGRYRSRGVHPPQSLSNTGLISRERVGLLQTSAPRQRTGKEGGVSGGNERFRTLSDAIFLSSASEDHETARRYFPAGLGWRTAYTRGIIDERSMDRVSMNLTSRKLRASRVVTTPPSIHESQTVVESNNSDVDAIESESIAEAASLQQSTGAIDQVDNIDTQNNGGEEPFVVVGDSNSAKPKSKQSLVSPPKQAVSNKSSPKNDNNKTDASTKSGANESKKSKTPKALGPEPKPANTNRNGHQAAAKGAPTDTPPSLREQPADPVQDASTNKRDQRNTKNTGREKGKHGNNQKGNAPRGPAENSQSTIDTSSQHGRQKGNKGDKGRSGAKDAQGGQNSGHEKKGKRGAAKSNKATASKASEERKKPSNDNAPVPSKPSGGDGFPNQLPELIMPLRPPPGLAPPPGFGRDEPMVDVRPALMNVSFPLAGSGGPTELGSMLTAALANTDLAMPGNSPSGTLPPLPFSQAAAGRSDLLFTNLGAETLPDISNTPTPDNLMTPGVHANVPPPNMSSHQQFLPPVQIEEPNNSQNGFDVMDFLDSILNDGGPGDQGGDQGENPGLLVPETHDEAPGMPLLSNPWATEGKSRAAAYGISFDDADDLSSEGSPILNARAATPSMDDGAAVANIPLLTPAALWLAGQDDEGGDAANAYSLFMAQEDAD